MRSPRRHRYRRTLGPSLPWSAALAQGRKSRSPESVKKIGTPMSPRDTTHDAGVPVNW